MTVLSENSSWFTVVNAAQAKKLHDAEEFRFFRPFLARENTISAAAKAVGVSVLRMYRKVQQLEMLGLVVLTRLEPRAGKATKYYKSVAEQFFVPNALSEADDFETMLLKEDDIWRRRLIRGMAEVAKDAMQQQGTYIFREAQGRIRRINHQQQGLETLPEDTAMTPTDTAIWSDWSLLRLEPDEARALHNDLRDLFSRYYKQTIKKPKGRFYVFRTAIAPLAEADSLAFVQR